MLQITGINLGPSDGVTASGTPLPTQLGDVQVLLNGKAIPLFSVFPTLILAQVPVDANPGSAQVVVQRDSGTSAAGVFTIAQINPSVRTADGSGYGQPWGALSGQMLAMSAASLGDASPALASGVVGSADTPSVPKAAISAFVGGIPTTATAAASTTRPGEYDVQVTVPAAAQPGDLIQLLVGNTLANPTVYQSLAGPTVAYAALPSGTATIEAITDANLDGNYLIATAARDSSGCYAGVVVDMLKQSATALPNCLTSAASGQSPVVQLRNGSALAALVGPAAGDSTSGISSTVQIFSPTHDPLTATLPFAASALTSALNGHFLATLPGSTPQSATINIQTGEVTKATAAGGFSGDPAAGGATGTATGVPGVTSSISVDGLTNALTREASLGPGKFAVVVGDDAENPTKAEFAILKSDGTVVSSQNFPDGWLPLLAAPFATTAPGNGPGSSSGTPAVTFRATRGSLLADQTGGTVYVVARSGDNSKHALAAFPADGSAPSVIAFPSGWFAASCTTSIPFYSLELSHSAVLIGSNSGSNELKTPCPGLGFLQLDLSQKTITAIAPSGQAQFSAGTAASVSDYVYASDAGTSGAATTLYVLDGASVSLFTLTAPSGVNGFSGLESVQELDSLVATATNTTAGDQGLLVFNLDQQTTSLLGVPDGFSSVSLIGTLTASRKLAARAVGQNGGSQLVIYDLVNTANMSVIDNPKGVSAVGTASTTSGTGAGGFPGGGFPGGGFPGGGFPGGNGGGFGGGTFTGLTQAGGSRLLRVNTSANTVTAMGLDGDNKQVGILVVRVP